MYLLNLVPLYQSHKKKKPQMPSDSFYRYFVKRSRSVDFFAKKSPCTASPLPTSRKNLFFQEKGPFFSYARLGKALYILVRKCMVKKGEPHPIPCKKG